MSEEARVEEALADFVEGMLDDAGRQRLAAWVRASDAHRRHFLEQTRVHLGLATLLKRDAAAQIVRRARLIPGSFSDERQRRLIESARAIRPPRLAARRRGLSAWAWAASLVALVSLGIGAAFLFSRKAIAVGQVATADAHALIERGARNLPAAGEVQVGDVLTAGSGAGLEIGFAGEATRIALRPGGRMQALAGPGKRFRLLAGSAAVAASPQPAGQPLVISTPRADIQVIGTAFTVACNPFMTWLEVEHGTVRFGDAADRLSLRVGAGQRALATDGVSVMPTDRGCGLLGNYYDGDAFARLALVRIDPTIDFDWQDQAPDPAVERSRFSIRWSGEIEPLYSEEYRFSVASDDGARLWIDGRLVVDNWRIQSVAYQAPASGIALLSAHRKVRIRLDFFEHEHLAAVRLSWESRSQTREIVPQSCLYPGPP